MKKTLFYFLTAILMIGCATNDLTISVTDPAPITLPSTIKNVGIVNRTNSNIDKTFDQIDKLATLELLSIDSVASLKSINGLYDQLRQNTRFTNVMSLSPLVLDNTSLNTFSPLLSQKQITDLCNKNGLDAIFVLEYYDTDTKIDFKIVPVTTTVLGVEVKAVETHATVNTAVSVGWRIYDASGSIVYDEFPVMQSVISSGKGINPLFAIQAVTGQKSQIENVSYNIGRNYAMQLLPISYRVSRIYYVKGSNNFKIGKRLARAGQWNQAADYWNKEINNPKSRIAGRAYYNMAIINEINGNLDDAIKWAEQSYTLFNNKKGLYYLNVLKYRKAKLEELRNQQN